MLAAALGALLVVAAQPAAAKGADGGYLYLQCDHVVNDVDKHSVGDFIFRLRTGDWRFWQDGGWSENKCLNGPAGWSSQCSFAPETFHLVRNHSSGLTREYTIDRVHGRLEFNYTNQQYAYVAHGTCHPIAEPHARATQF
ncbi:MAG: hypothetical protein GC190_12915 [Alphaproteobacteria bacterium]|nr:hypothetical protein [Alphaproteobacteria bacterium]